MKQVALSLTDLFEPPTSHELTLERWREEIESCPDPKELATHRARAFYEQDTR